MLENKSGRSLVIARFRKEILKEQAHDNKKAKQSNVILSIIPSVVTISISLGVFIFDYFNRKIGLTTKLGMIGLLSLVLISFLKIFLTLFTNKFSEFTNRILELIYKTIYFVAVTMLIINHNQVISHYDVLISYSTISFASMYLLTLCISPSSYLFDSLFLGVVSIGALIAPLFFPGKEYYNILFYSVLLIIFIITYIFFYINTRLHLVSQEKLVKTNDNLIDVSFLDAMTNTFNRRAYYEYIRHLSNDDKVERVGAIIFDIDDFKAYNDLYSHSKGDECLQNISRIIMDVLDQEGVYLFRYGGEEFVAFIDNPTKEQMIDVSKRMVSEVYNSKFQRYDTQYKRVTITCGVAILNVLHGVNADYVIKADEQLYIGKSQGKNCVVFEGEKY